jgi:hypothetical protein
MRSARLDDVLSRPKVVRRLDPEAMEHVREVIAAAPVTPDPPTVPVSRDPKDDYLRARPTE